MANVMLQVESLREEVTQKIMDLARDFSNAGDVELARYISEVAERTGAALEDMREMVGDVIDQRDEALMEVAQIKAAMLKWQTTQNPHVRELVEMVEEEMGESDYVHLSEVIEDEMFDRVMEGLMATGISRTAASVLAEAILDGSLAGQEEALEFMAAAAAYGLGYAEAEGDQVGE